MFTPSFDRETLTYQAVVGNAVTSVNVQAVAEDANATVTGSGDHTLSVGNNSILITVTAENNTFRAYTINVYREPSSNNNLSDLQIDQQTVSGFAPSKLSYSFTVANQVTELEILGIAEDATASVSGNKTWYLNTGVNRTDIVVTAEDGTSKIYQLEVTREKSSNNQLAILNTLEGNLNPSFDPATTSYTLDVPYEVTKLTLTTVAEDASATVEIEGNVYQILEFQHVKPGKGAAFVRTKLKNIINGGVVEKTFRPTEKFENAHIERKEMQYLYNDGDLFNFMDNETFEQIAVNAETVGDSLKFVRENENVKLSSYQGSVFAIEPPLTVELEITETEPGFKGDTAQGATKPAIVETGAQVNVPLFVEQGEKIKIDTRTGEYLSRV